MLTKKKATYDKKRRAKRLDEGLCTDCGEQPYLEGRKRCKTCLDTDRDLQLVKRTKQRERVYAAYGNQCSCACGCAISVWYFLTLDHVDGNGNQHRAEIGEDLVRWADKNGCPPTLRLLCSNCNTGRERNKGTCPGVVQIFFGPSPC